MALIDPIYSDFIPYLYDNELVMLRGVTASWTLSSDLILENKDINEVMVPVDTDLGRIDMHFSDFLSMAKTKVAYCRDWHIDRVFRELYSVPQVFRDDWLNWYWHVVCPQAEDDYSFCYVGSMNSKTARHHDVVLSYSWSVSLCGVKRWSLWRPGTERDNEAIQLIQQPGDAIFVPSGWYHEVENVVDEEKGFTVSLNRNWFNGFNLFNVWTFILKEHQKVCDELRHLFEPVEVRETPQESLFQSFGGGEATPLMSAGEWHTHCDIILRANAAFNLRMFLMLITARILLMATTSSTTISSKESDSVLPMASALFCDSEFLPSASDEERELFLCQKTILTPAGCTVWVYTLGEVQRVVQDMQTQPGVMRALPFLFDCQKPRLEHSLAEIIHMCDKLK